MNRIVFMNTELNTGVIKVFELKYPGYKSFWLEYSYSDLTESGAACLRLVRQISPSLPQAKFFSLSQSFSQFSCALLAGGAGVLLDQAKIIFVHLGLTSLAELGKVAFEDSLEGRDLVACEDSNASRTRSSWLRPKRTQKALASLLSTMQGSPSRAYHMPSDRPCSLLRTKTVMASSDVTL